MVVVKLNGTEPEESFEDKGVVYERTDHIHIDLNSIPDHVRDDLARATLEDAKEFYSHPENEVEYQNGLQPRKQRGCQNEDTVHKKRGCYSAVYKFGHIG